MKILVLSLMRIGDILLGVPAIKAIRRQYPDAKIDLVVNEGFESIANLIEEIDHVHLFNRKFYQSTLLDKETPIFEGFDAVEDWLSDIASQKYDMVINLTQNKLSGYIAGLIDVPTYLGFAFNTRSQATFSSQWFRYLNDVVACDAETIFHYVDIFHFGCGGKKGEQDWRLRETAKGKQEVEEFFKIHGYSSQPKLVVQALTSDSKKNWGLDNWQKAIWQIKMAYPELNVILLGAPNETTQIEKLQSGLQDEGVASRVAILSLEGALSLLSVSDALLTGDTSIKHMANATSIKTIEIAIGSSDLRKTGSYSDGTVIISSRAKCQPCPHSSDCYQEEHLCGTGIAPELVSTVTVATIRRDGKALRAIAEEFGEEANVYLTDKKALGFWNVNLVSSTKSSFNLENKIEKLAWQFLLNGEHHKEVGPFGSESLRISEDISSEAWGKGSGEALQILNSFEARVQRAENQAEKILSALNLQMRTNSSLLKVEFLNDTLKREIQFLEKDLKLGKFLSEKVRIDSGTGLYRFRQIQNSLTDTYSLQQIKLKLIRRIRAQIEGVI